MRGVTLVTCTGGRPEALALCAQYVARFENPDNLPVQWLVVDDGQAAPTKLLTECFVEEADQKQLDYISPNKPWASGTNTLASNLLTAIPYIKYDCVLFIEDDDWYAPDYMYRQVERLNSSDLVGEAESRYYNLPTRKWRVFTNVTCASLCQTGIHARLLPLLKGACKSSSGFIDWILWSYPDVTSKYLAGGTPHVIGIKGMPGRPGIGIGHRPELGAGWNHDPNHETLRNWLRKDAEAYISKKYAAEHVQNSAETR